TDPKLYTYGIENPIVGIEALTSTTLRNIIGDLDLDETLTSRDIINTRMRSILDEATDPWGIKVNRVELKNIIPPKDIREAMERQMRAEREKREKVLLAEAHKASAILEAEGEKESQILRADAEKESAILRAQGEAQSIIEINKAKAEGIRLIKEAGADESVIALKSFEALVDVAKGQATKLIIPSNMQDLGSIVASIKEIASTTNDKAKK
ncbi:MAG: SPFH/Band 7/PHB domain protein, partial [bacterium]|nr:SPFH/Band 7/PHB domain protein [bacterium]